MQRRQRRIRQVGEQRRLLFVLDALGFAEFPAPAARCGSARAPRRASSSPRPRSLRAALRRLARRCRSCQACQRAEHDSHRLSSSRRRAARPCSARTAGEQAEADRPSATADQRAAGEAQKRFAPPLADHGAEHAAGRERQRRLAGCTGAALRGRCWQAAARTKPAKAIEQGRRSLQRAAVEAAVAPPHGVQQQHHPPPGGKAEQHTAAGRQARRRYGRRHCARSAVCRCATSPDRHLSVAAEISARYSAATPPAPASALRAAGRHSAAAKRRRRLRVDTRFRSD